MFNATKVGKSAGVYTGKTLNIGLKLGSLCEKSLYRTLHTGDFFIHKFQGIGFQLFAKIDLDAELAGVGGIDFADVFDVLEQFGQIARADIQEGERLTFFSMCSVEIIRF